MKHILRIVIIGSFIAGLNSCKKDNSNFQAGPIVGKWQETKLIITESNGTATVKDTTFSGSSLTPADYAQFNKDKTAEISESGVFEITGKSDINSGGLIRTGLGQYTYTIADSILTLTVNPLFAHPSNGSGSNSQTVTIEHLDDTHLVLHTYFYSPAPFNITQTAYFTKKS